MGRSFTYFATEEDIRSIVIQVDNVLSLKYYEYGNFLESEKKDILKFDSLMQYPLLGHEKKAVNRFVVLPSYIDIVYEEREGRDGKRIVIDQLMNQQSVTWHLGGFVSDTLLFRGEIATAYINNVSLEILNSLRKMFSKTFKKSGAYYIGPGVFNLHDVRLIRANINEPMEYDFKLPGHQSHGDGSFGS